MIQGPEKERHPFRNTLIVDHPGRLYRRYSEAVVYKIVKTSISTFATFISLSIGA